MTVVETPFRPLITIVRVTPDERQVEVTLDMDGRLSTGRADVDDRGSLSTAGVATCSAVEQMMPPGVGLTLAWSRHLEAEEGRRALLLASVVVVAPSGEPEELLGAAFVRNDLHVAAVRATLDGLTRRLARFVHQG